MGMCRVEVADRQAGRHRQIETHELCMMGMSSVEVADR